MLRETLRKSVLATESMVLAPFSSLSVRGASTKTRTEKDTFGPLEVRYCIGYNVPHLIGVQFPKNRT